MQTVLIKRDGTKVVTGEPDPESTSELKEIGAPYTLNGITYQIPLTESAQNLIGIMTTGYIAAVIEGTLDENTIRTTLKFSETTSMPITTSEWMPFAKWFRDERGKYFPYVDPNAETATV